MKTEKKTEKKKSCIECGKQRFKTVKKTYGVRTLVACRNCGQLHGWCY